MERCKSAQADVKVSISTIFAKNLICKKNWKKNHEKKGLKYQIHQHRFSKNGNFSTMGNFFPKKSKNFSKNGEFFSKKIKKLFQNGEFFSKKSKNFSKNGECFSKKIEIFFQNENFFQKICVR